MAAPVEIICRDGQWEPGRNHVALWPWQSKELSAAELRIYLLEISTGGGVRLLLEPMGASSTALAPVAVMPGELIEW
ncbi:hypothetical protein ECTOBSL9_0991 [Ectothiorhodospira sp. BSL-9]|nr:hypothetical protein ECTOBSL9_0991 [Ectothiorhodospira sp. BSL-9]